MDNNNTFDLTSLITAIYKNNPVLFSSIITLIAGGFGGFLGYIIRGCTLSKKEREDLKNEAYKRFEGNNKQLEEAYTNYVSAISKLIQNEADLDKFLEISNKGEIYFSISKTISQGILEKRFSENAIVNNYLNPIKELANKTLPQHYNTLAEMAKNMNVVYNGHLKKENYISIYKVYDKYKLDEYI